MQDMEKLYQKRLKRYVISMRNEKPVEVEDANRRR